MPASDWNQDLSLLSIQLMDTGAICGIYSCGPDMIIFMSGPSLGPCGIRFVDRLRYHNLDNE